MVSSKDRIALRAVVDTVLQSFRDECPALRTYLTGVPGINLNEQLTSVLGFVSYLLVQARPGRVRYASGKTPVPDHYAGGQLLGDDKVVLIDVLPC